MDPKVEVMVALGAAIGANCIPCFDHLYAKAREVSVGRDDIEEVVEIAFKVKSGAGLFMKNAVAEVAGGQDVRETPCCSPASECKPSERCCS
jgi:hypothetical protein